MSNFIHFWGTVDDVLPFLQMSDYYIMPSSAEGFGNATIEAMSSGLKPILSAVKALIDFKNYYDITDIIWIKPTLDDIVKTFKLIEKIGDPNYEYRKKLHNITKSNFGLNVGATKYYELYKQIHSKKN